MEKTTVQVLVRIWSNGTPQSVLTGVSVNKTTLVWNAAKRVHQVFQHFPS
jgi:hypothetical protein